MQPPVAASRRVVTTIPLRDPSPHPHPHYKQPTLPVTFHHARKFAAARPLALRLPPPLLLAASALLLLCLYTLLARFAPDCAPPPFDLIPALERWRDPVYARQRLSVYVYELPPRFNVDLVRRSIREPGPIRDPQCDANFYSSEVHVHRFLLDSAVRTRDPEEADFFYVPVYTTCDLITHQPNDVPRVGRNFRAAMNHVISDFPFWNRSNGRDHVYLFSQGFSARLAGDWGRYKNGVFMVHNGEFTAPEYTPHKDFTIPPELRAYFRPFWTEGGDAVEQSSRGYLAQFGGQVLSVNITDHRGSNYSGGVRQYIQEYLTEREGYRITGVRSDTYISDMKSSKFCLSPEGWHPWSPRPYYSVMMGCIPVIISEVQELAFEEFVDWDNFVLWVRPRDITRIDSILRSIPDAEIRRRRAAMKKVWRALWYAQDGLANQAILRSLYIRKYDSAPKRYFSGSQ